MRAVRFALGVVLFAFSGIVSAEDAVFSGPQIGEKLPGFEFRGVYDDQAGEPLDVVTQAGLKPVILVFVHETTRPGLGLTRVVLDYAAKRQNDGLHAAVVFLTDDATATESWMRIPSVRQSALPQGVASGIYPEGKEGPGAYGLNRNVSLTVLVAKDNRVTANFALVQPSVQADGPKIFQAIVDVLGGGDVPDVAQFSGQDRGARMVRPEQDPNLRPLLTRVIRRDATAEQVDEAAKAVEAYADKNADARKEIGRIGRRIIDAGKLADYGTPTAQKYLEKWAKEYAEDAPADGKDKPNPPPERK
jgi:hypothetical protein